MIDDFVLNPPREQIQISIGLLCIFDLCQRYESMKKGLNKTWFTVWETPKRAQDINQLTFRRIHHGEVRCLIVIGESNFHDIEWKILFMLKNGEKRIGWMSQNSLREVIEGYKWVFLQE